MVDLELLENNYFVNMTAIPYKLKKGDVVNIYPILVKDYLTYCWAKNILTIKKNEINDISVIQMSYLKFLISRVLPNDENSIGKLYWILKLCLHEDNVSVGDDCIILYDENKIIKNVIGPKEFDEIAKTILAQNDINYDDRYVSPEVEELMKEYYSAKYKSIVSPSLEKRKAFVSSKIGKTFEQINELPYREFDLIYEACKDSEIYIGQKIIQGSYKYETKEDIKHPLFEEKKDPYEELFTDTSALANKGISGAENLIAMNLQENI